ncbi:MAG: hypothetical protein PHR94_11000 [Methylomonas lenta]|nr:hypothetical protein [Methylomonas lenta]
MTATKKPSEKNPRTMRDALAAQVLGDIDLLLDKADLATAKTTASVERLEETIRRLEEAGESYNQAVLAANMRSKKELMAYLKTVTTATVSATADEQREVLRGLLRELVSDEISALKLTISGTAVGHKVSSVALSVKMAVMCMASGLIASAATVAVIRWIG